MNGYGVAMPDQLSGAQPDQLDDRPLILVTGGSGMLGSTLIERLLDDFRVVSLDLDGDPTSATSVEFICTDLTDDSSVERAFDRIRSLYGNQIASVVHLAAYYDFSGAASPMYEKVTVEGTGRLLDALTDFDVEQFVFSSTMLVHTPTDLGDEIDESDPIEKTWAYPASKVETEHLIREHPTSSRISNVIARIAGVYDEDGNSPPLTNQIKRIDGRWPTSHFYPAELERGQAFVHLDDAADALERTVRRRADLPSWFPVLIGEPETIGYGQLQDAIAEELWDRSWPTMRVPVPLAKVGAWVREKSPFLEDPFIRSWMVDRASDNYDLDVSVAEEHLGWTPQHTVLGSIPEMIRRLRADREGWYARNGMKPPHRVLPA